MLSLGSTTGKRSLAKIVLGHSKPIFLAILLLGLAVSYGIFRWNSTGGSGLDDTGVLPIPPLASEHASDRSRSAAMSAAQEAAGLAPEREPGTVNASDPGISDRIDTYGKGDDDRPTPLDDFLETSRSKGTGPDADIVNSIVDRVAANHAFVVNSPDANWTREAELRIEQVYASEKIGSLPTSIAANNCRAAGCELQIVVHRAIRDDVLTKELEDAWDKFLRRVKAEISIRNDMDEFSRLQIRHANVHLTRTKRSPEMIMFFWVVFELRPMSPTSPLPQ